MAKHTQHGGPVDASAGHETSDAHFKPIVYFLIGLTVLVVISFALMVWMFVAMERRAELDDVPPSPLADPAALPPEPRLQVTPSGDFEAYSEVVDRQLESYEWIDQAGGVVRIPVERAMELLAERGEVGAASSEAGQGAAKE